MRRALLPASAAVLGALLAGAVLRQGPVMGPDSWAYWEGSVSLLETRTYCYFGDVPITSFPPLFPAVLALAQLVLGVSAGALSVTVVALVALSSCAWTALYLRLRGGGPVAPSDALVAVLVPASLATWAQTLLSETLWLALLPLLLGCALPVAGAASRARRVAAAWVLLSLLLLCRNVTVGLLPGLLLFAACAERPRAGRVMASLAVALGGVASWHAVRQALGQSGSPPGTGLHGFLAYVGQAVAGLARALGPERLGLGPALLCGIAVVVAWTLPRSGPGRRWVGLFALATVGVLGEAALFSVTYVAEPLAGRFVTFAALLLSLVAIGLARAPGRPGAAATVLSLLLTGVALGRCVQKVRLAGSEQPTLAHDVTITSSHWSGPPQRRGNLTLVAPPNYGWLRRPPPR